MGADVANIVRCNSAIGQQKGVQMRNRWRLSWYIAVVSLILGACADNVSIGDSRHAVGTLTATSTPLAGIESRSSTPTSAPNLTGTPNQTLRLTDTFVLPTPPLPPDIVEDFFFADSHPDCHLPCWQGLVIGESGRTDIQDMFDTVLAFDGNREFIPETPPEAESNPLPSGTYATGHLWYPSAEDPLQTFGIAVYYEQDTFLLQAIAFGSQYPPFNAMLSPQRIIRELGQPSHFLMALGGTERGDIAGLRLQMVYDDAGMVFDIHVLTPIALSITQGSLDGSLELCLGGERWGQGYDTGFWSIYILEPLENGLEGLSPLQEALITHFGSDHEEMIPVAGFFDVSLDTITELALQDGDACLYAEFSE